jgi:hypothetical protein
VASHVKKLNFIIQGDVARDLETLVPAGERSRMVNEALRKELLALKRRTLSRRLTEVRERGPIYGTDDLVNDLRRERNRR